MENSNEKENNDDNFAVPTQTHGKKFTINLPTYLRKLAKYMPTKWQYMQLMFNHTFFFIILSSDS